VEATSTNSDDTHRLALRAELNKLKPDFVSQSDWDELMDEQDKQDRATLAAMIKAGTQYEADHPEEPVDSAPADVDKIPSMEEWLAEQGEELDPTTPVESAVS
jgi:hypothetical protein